MARPKLTEQEKLSRLIDRLGLEDITVQVNREIGTEQFFKFYACVVRHNGTHEIMGYRSTKDAFRSLRVLRRLQRRGEW